MRRLDKGEVKVFGIEPGKSGANTIGYMPQVEKLLLMRLKNVYLKIVCFNYFRILHYMKFLEYEKFCHISDRFTEWQNQKLDPGLNFSVIS